MTHPPVEGQPVASTAPLAQPLTQAAVAADLANAFAPVALPVLNAVEAANVVSLVQAHDLATEVMFQAAERSVTSLIENFTDWYQFHKITEMAAAVAKLATGFALGVARLSDIYMASMIGELAGKKVKPTGTRKTRLLPPHIIERQFGRVADTYRWQQSKVDTALIHAVATGDIAGADLVSPQQAALHRAHQTIRSDLAYARRAQLHHNMSEAAERGLIRDKYRRVIHPELADEGTCGLCIAASTRLYNVGDLMPIHPGCHCGEVPVGIDGEDPGGAINDYDLKNFYDDAGDNSADALRKTRYRVDEHGELGPVLRPEGAPIRTEDEAKADIRNPAQKNKNVNDERRERRTRLATAKRDDLQSSRDLLAKQMRESPDQFPSDKWLPIYEEMGTRIKDLDRILGILGPKEEDSLFTVAEPSRGLDYPQIEGTHTLADDVHATNPLFLDGSGAYAINCVHVVAAEELRRRGFDVAATPLPESMWLQNGRSLDLALNMWVPYRPMTESSAVGAKNIAQQWPDGARGWVSLTWKQGGSHVFNVEKVGDRTVWSDAQKGVSDIDPDTYFNRAMALVKIVRVDDLTPSDQVSQFARIPGERENDILTSRKKLADDRAVRQEKLAKNTKAYYASHPEEDWHLTPVGAAEESSSVLRMNQYTDLSLSLRGKIEAKLTKETHLPEPELAAKVQENFARLYAQGDKSELDWYQRQKDDLASRATALGMPLDRLLGIVSVTSAHKRWTQNKDFAEGIAAKLTADEPFQVTKMMIADFNSWAGKHRGKLAAPHPDLLPGTYRPSELPSDFAASKTPGIPKAFNTDIGIRAVKIFRGELSVDEAVNGPKQRNFVNNLLHPDDPRFVTVDTWHYRAAMAGIPITHEVKGHSYSYTIEQWMDRDLSVTDGRAALYGYDETQDRYSDNNLEATIKAADNMNPQTFFQSSPSSVADDNYDYGTYPWFVHQTQIGAEAAGVSPAAFQAVVWYALGGGMQ